MNVDLVMRSYIEGVLRYLRMRIDGLSWRLMSVQEILVMGVVALEVFCCKPYESMNDIV